jgi:sRNA-binding protein
VLGCAPAELPKVFLSDKPKPLVIGVHDELLKRFPGADRAKLSRWLKLWTRSRFYLFARISGRARQDLDGVPVTAISDDDRSHALRVLKSGGLKLPAPKPKRASANGRPILHLPSLAKAAP